MEKILSENESFINPFDVILSTYIVNGYGSSSSSDSIFSLLFCYPNFMSYKKFESSFLKCFESYLFTTGLEEVDEVEAEFVAEVEDADSNWPLDEDELSIESSSDVEFSF